MKYALDFLMGCVVALCMGLFFYGIVRYPDAPFRPCATGPFCGKGNRPHTEEEYRRFVAWEGALIMSWPFGMAAGFVLELRSRRRASLAWNRLRGLQSHLPAAIEEHRYEAAWRSLRRRNLVARALFVPALTGIAWASSRGSIAEGGAFVLLTLFAFAFGSNFRYVLFRCPRCSNRYFRIQGSSWANQGQCVHCGLPRGTTFAQALAELNGSVDA